MMKMKKDEKEVISKYNKIAEKYHDSRNLDKGNFYNQMLEMPTTLKLLGNVKGKKILDFGCGTGIYAKVLTKKGAIVKGFDISPKMLEIAKKENPNLDLKRASGYKIPFKEKFDIVLASLVIGYLENWKKVFKQVSKVLKKKGIFVFSIGNPVSECTETKKIKGVKVKVFEDYFKEKKFYNKWKNIDMPFYHKTYETIIKTILKNGFEIIDYADAFPLETSKKLFPDDYNFAKKFPMFTSWKVRKK